MLAMRRIAKVTGRTAWLMSSMKNINGLMNQAIHQGTFGPKKCEKYFTNPCSFTPYTVSHHEDDHRHRECGVEIVGRRKETRNQTERIREENHQRAGADQRQEVLGRLGAHEVGRHVVGRADDRLDEAVERDFALGEDVVFGVLETTVDVQAHPEEEEHDDGVRDHVLHAEVRVVLHVARPRKPPTSRAGGIRRRAGS